MAAICLAVLMRNSYFLRKSTCVDVSGTGPPDLLPVHAVWTKCRRVSGRQVVKVGLLGSWLLPVPAGVSVTGLVSPYVSILDGPVGKKSKVSLQPLYAHTHTCAHRHSHMHSCVHIYSRTHTHTGPHTQTHTRVFVHTFSCACTHLHMHTCMHGHACIIHTRCIHMCACIHSYMHTYSHVHCTHTCTHTFTHTLARMLCWPQSARFEETEGVFALQQ